MVHDDAGHLFVCSEDGLYAYDGRGFYKLGPAQGLPNGGFVHDLVRTGDGRIAVRYIDSIFVSAPIPAAGILPDHLLFRRARLGTTVVYSGRRSQMAPWRGGVAVLVDGQLFQIDAGAAEAPRLVPIAYSASDRSALSGAVKIFSVRGSLWETFDDDRVCSADPGSVVCYGRAQGLVNGPWQDVAPGRDNELLLRSATSMATLDQRSGTAREDILPDQGGRYLNYREYLGLFRTASGALVTQARDGLLVRGSGGWTPLTINDGVPEGVIVSALSQGGHLWLQVLGRGLFMALGYGHWQSLQKSDGLSDSITWQAVQTANDAFWVATDEGVDEIRIVDDAPTVARVVPGASFALALAPDGHLWSSAGQDGIGIIDPATATKISFATPPINAIANGNDGRLWLATERGLFVSDDQEGGRPGAHRDGSSTRPILTAIADQEGGVWLLSEGQLWHRHADGALVLVTGAWPKTDFDPDTMLRAPNGRFWFGGSGGLFEATIRQDHVSALSAVPSTDIQGHDVVALALDRRGWLWVGTGQGVSVFDGKRWVSADSSDGLIWNDVSQNGLLPARDGSVWIMTSRGLSRLRDPAWLFQQPPLEVVITKAVLGSHDLTTRPVPFSRDPLLVEFGTFNYAAASIRYRFKMEDVDSSWVEAVNGIAQYPFVPPGRHVLTVVAEDTLDHRVSPAVRLVIRMRRPWWQQRWAQAIGALLACGALYGWVKWRERNGWRRQRTLEKLVEERTLEITRAQAELRRQATLDGLTGLLNRTELQRRLVDGLCSSPDIEHTVVALLDLDHFKQVNDRFGHLAGDDVLRLTAVRISAVLREREYAGRYGGEEILIVLRDDDEQGADRILRLHQAIRQAPFYVEQAEIAVTCSVGVTWAGPGDDWRSLVRRADAALYEAKSLGRDRVVERRDDAVASARPSSGLG